MFHGEQCVHACEFVHDLSAVASSYQLLLVSSVVRHGAVYFRATCISVLTPMRNRDLLEGVGENFDVNFAMKEFPAYKQFTIR
jgi:hypothetical protein